MEGHRLEDLVVSVEERGPVGGGEVGIDGGL